MAEVQITTYDGETISAAQQVSAVTVYDGGTLSGGGGGAVDSVNGQVGVVVLNAADVDAEPEGATAAAVAAHSEDTTGVHGIADTADLIVEGDSRLTDSRAPSGAAGGVLSGTYPNPGFAADMATQAELDAEAALARNADNLTSGTIATARLGSGTADNTTFLRGDQTWAAPAGGGGDVATDSIFDAKGDLAVGTGADTATKLTVGANGTILMADSTQSTGLKYNKGTWKAVIDDPLSTTAAFKTAQAGTWAINSGVLRQSAGGKARIATLAHGYPTGAIAIEVEIAHISSSTSSRRFGIFPRFNNAGSPSPVAYLESSNGTSWTFKVEHDSSALVYTHGSASSYGGSGYVKFQAIATGYFIDYYLDGTYITSLSHGFTTTDQSIAQSVGFYTNETTADFRNLKVWTAYNVPW